MHRSLLLVLVLGSLLGLTMCGGGGGGGSAPPSVQPLVGGTITGSIADQNGTRLANVNVRTSAGANAPTATTNEQGFFALVDVPAGTPVLTFKLAGYVENMKAVAVADGRNSQITVTMQNVGTSQQVDVTQPVTVAHRDGRVELPAGGIVDTNGQPVANAVVSVTTLIPGDANFIEAFPGEFIGNDAGDRGPLISFGVVDVSLTDSSGNALRLAAGQTATVEFPIPPAPHDTGDATIPLWYLDTATAEWIRQGTTTRDAGAGVYRGTVSHFTPWNCDARPPDSWKRIRLTFNGVPVPAATLRIDGLAWAAGGTTDGNGEVLLNVPAGVAGTVRMLGADGTWITLRASETMAPAGETFVNDYTEADGVVQQIATVILGWGEAPSDLDAHTTVPTSGGRTHVYYAAMGDLVNSPFCALNTDDVTSFGPEITTVTRALPGTYRFTVHNYSTNAEHPITESAATVILITRDRGARIYSVPPDNPANEVYWAVFDLVFDAAGNLTIQDVNQFGNNDVLLL